MVRVVFIHKNGNITCSNIKKFDEKTLYKKCKLKNNENFEKRHTWKFDNSRNISLYAKVDGKAKTENKYDLPPPLDNDLYFGCMVLCAHKDDNLTKETIQDLSKEEWKQLYDKLMGGFEDLGEDSERSEDEEDIDDDMLTKEGYLKDSFIADDNESVEAAGKEDDSEKEYSGDETVSSHEYDSGDDSDDESEIPEENSELDEEEYEY